MAVRMAHIQLPEDLGIEDAILPGDPARVDRVAALLEQPEELMFNREYKSVRGLWKGRPVLIISTGSGRSVHGELPSRSWPAPVCGR